MKKYFLIAALSLFSTSYAVTTVEVKDGIRYAELESFAKDIGARFQDNSNATYKVYLSDKKDLFTALNSKIVSFGGLQYALPFPTILSRNGKPALPLDNLESLFEVKVQTQTNAPNTLEQPTQNNPTESNNAPSTSVEPKRFSAGNWFGSDINVTLKGSGDSSIQFFCTSQDYPMFIVNFGRFLGTNNKDSTVGVGISIDSNQYNEKWHIDSTGKSVYPLDKRSDGSLIIPRRVPNDFVRYLLRASTLSITAQGQNTYGLTFDVRGADKAFEHLSCQRY